MFAASVFSLFGFSLGRRKIKNNSYDNPSVAAAVAAAVVAAAVVAAAAAVAVSAAVFVRLLAYIFASLLLFFPLHFSLIN